MSFEEDFTGPDFIASIDHEQEWEKGQHTDQNGVTRKLKDMSDSHLRNTIRYFKDDLDIKPLQKEYDSRTSG